MVDYKVVDTEKLEAGLSATADAIREKTGNTEKIDWKENGMADQVDKVFEAGKKSKYDAFWDGFQENGMKTKYEFAFCGEGWNSNTFYPKYSIIPLQANFIFAYISHKTPFDLCTRLNDQNIILDFSKNTNFTNSFLWSGVETLGVIDTTSASSIDTLFSYAHYLKKVEKLILKSDGGQTCNTTFDGCQNLIDITIEGVFSFNLSVKSCKKLSKNSIINVINALSPTTSGFVATLSLSSVNNAFETSPGAADGSTSEEWLALANTKPNWTISLV